MACDVTQDAVDLQQLSGMVEKAKETLGDSIEKAVADKGYLKTNELRNVGETQIEPVVKPIPRRGEKQGKFAREDFAYKENEDIYLCPDGKELQWITTKKTKREERYRMYKADPDDCAACALRAGCLRDEKTNGQGRSLQVLADTELTQAIHKTWQNPDNHELYKKRKSVIEPMIGIVKHNLGFRRFSLRGLKKVKGEIGLLATVYNLQRIATLWDSKGGPAPIPGFT